MNQKFISFRLLVLCLFVLNTTYAQLSITAQASGFKFLGDVGKFDNENFYRDTKLGIGLGVEYRLGKIIGIGIDGMYGKLAGSDNSSHLNFQSTIFGGSLSCFSFFDRLSKKEKIVTPFVHAGIGYLQFDSYGDLRDRNSTVYNYWSDGTIRNLSESPTNVPLSVEIKRDYTYESQLKDSTINYNRGCLYIPLGIGAKFQMGFRTNLRIGVSYNLCMSDYIDNYKAGGTDSWVAANIGVNIHLGKKHKDAFTNANTKAINNIDSDGDGINDNIDKCTNTPLGIKVNGNGCPDDTDEDGVFDYLDKELNTIKGSKVDVNGVTISEQEIAKRRLAWDTLANQRSEGFNNAPSLSYLKNIEAKSKENQSLNGKKNTLPEELKEADYDKDGNISVSEITKTIDGFFEGINSFNVSKINRLIDYFFEQ